MHELYTLQRTALEGYATYNFPKGVCASPIRVHTLSYTLNSVVMSALGHFANITLSSLYFDITKDCLYANSTTSLERRAVVTILEQVSQLISLNSINNSSCRNQILDTMTAIYAPILPHLAEEVHAIRYPESKSSFFARDWTPLVRSQATILPDY